ncbi:MAG: hypothetical protein ACE5FN_01295 [Leptospirillia bacterium]
MPVLFASPGTAQEIPSAGIPGALATYAPIPVDFGTISVSAAAGEVAMSVRNLGTIDLIFSSIVSNNPVFTLAPGDPPVIPPGETGIVRLSFKPTQAGQESGQVEFVSNDLITPVFRLPVMGEGVDVKVSLSPGHRLVLSGREQQFSSTVTGTLNSAVNWSVTNGGSISNSGLYTAPILTGTDSVLATIRATSVADPTRYGEASVLVVTPEMNQLPTANLGAARFGEVVSVVDLDKDGNHEVIAGAPGANVDTGAGILSGAGQVWIRTFDGNGFTTPARLIQSPAPVAGGGFGSAMLAVDVNLDSVPDLVVGEPGGDGPVSGSGAVHVFFGDGTGGFDAPHTYFPADLGTGDDFGARLTMGYFSRGTLPEVAVAAPWHTVNGLAGAGAVYIFTDDGTGVVETLSTPLTARQPETAAGFGRSLITVCLQECTAYGISGEKQQRNDLVIGAPGASVETSSGMLAGAGRVFAVDSSIATDGTLSFSGGIEILSPSPVAGAGFGQALATLNLDGDVTSDLVIAAPGQPVRKAGQTLAAGMVFIYLGDGTGRFHAVNHLQNPEPSTGDRFGATLVPADINVDGIQDLSVGVPGAVAGGRIDTFFGAGNGNVKQLWINRVPSNSSSDSYGTAIAWRDLNRDGVADLISGAPDTVTDGIAGAGELLIRLAKPIPNLQILPLTATVEQVGNKNTFEFQGNIPSGGGGWSVIGSTGSISPEGIFSAPATLADPLDSSILVRMGSGAYPDTWALARITLLRRWESVASPELVISSNGSFQFNPPQEGINFGQSIDIAPIGRFATDPSRDRLTLLGSFPALNTGVIPHINAYPFDDDPTRSNYLDAGFPSMLPYLGREEDARSGWGQGLAHGDLNGDGNMDLVVAAPTMPSIDGAQNQVGAIDLYRLDATGGYQGIPVRLTASQTMLDTEGNPLWPDPALRSNTRYGYNILVHDLNGDGNSDIIVAAPHADVAGVHDAGLVEVLMAPADGNWGVKFTRAIILEPTLREGGYFGSAIAVGDLAGSGNPQLFVSSTGHDPQGGSSLNPIASIVYGFAPASWDHMNAAALRDALAGAEILTINDPVNNPSEFHGGFGMSIVLGNLITNDGADEMVISAPTRVVDDPLRRDFLGRPYQLEIGQLFFYDGGTGFTVGVPHPISSPFRQANSQFGSKLDTAHLSTDPAAPESLVVSAPFFDTEAGINAGALFTFTGTVNDPPRFHRIFTVPSGVPLELFGSSLAVGDLNRDGIDEIAAGAPDANISVLLGYRVYPGRFGGVETVIDMREQAGRVYVIFPGF